MTRKKPTTRPTTLRAGSRQRVYFVADHTLCFVEQSDGRLDWRLYMVRDAQEVFVAEGDELTASVLLAALEGQQE